MAKDPPRLSRPDHRESVRLAWTLWHVPWGTLAIAVLALVGVVSVILTVIALGPANPVP